MPQRHVNRKGGVNDLARCAILLGAGFGALASWLLGFLASWLLGSLAFRNGGRDTNVSGLAPGRRARIGDSSYAAALPGLVSSGG